MGFLDSLKEMFGGAAENVQDKVQDVNVEDLQQKAQDTGQQVSEQTQQTTEQVGQKVEEAKDKLTNQQ